MQYQLAYRSTRCNKKGAHLLENIWMCRSQKSSRRTSENQYIRLLKFLKSVHLLNPLSVCRSYSLFPDSDAHYSWFQNQRNTSTYFYRNSKGQIFESNDKGLISSNSTITSVHLLNRKISSTIDTVNNCICNFMLFFYN